MERYEFSEGSSQKFWEVAVNDKTLVVRFGRIGADGQTKEKSFDSADAAIKEKTKLVKEKTGKGYVAVDGKDASAPASAAAASRSAPIVEAPPATPEAHAAIPLREAGIAKSATNRNAIVKDTPLPTRTRPGAGAYGTGSVGRVSRFLFPAARRSNQSKTTGRQRLPRRSLRQH